MQTRQHKSPTNANIESWERANSLESASGIEHTSLFGFGSETNARNEDKPNVMKFIDEEWLMRAHVLDVCTQQETRLFEIHIRVVKSSHRHQDKMQRTQNQRSHNVDQPSQQSNMGRAQRKKQLERVRLACHLLLQRCGTDVVAQPL